MQGYTLQSKASLTIHYTCCLKPQRRLPMRFESNAAQTHELHAHTRTQQGDPFDQPAQHGQAHHSNFKNLTCQLVTKHIHTP